MAEVQGSKIEFFDYSGNTELEMGYLSYLSGYVEDGKEIVGINIKNAENTTFYDTSMINVEDNTFKMSSINNDVLKKGDVTATLILKDESGKVENIESSISYFPSDIKSEVISNTSFMKGFVYISGLATNVEEGDRVEVTLKDKEGNFIKSPIEVNSESEWATYIGTGGFIGNDLSYAVNYEGVDPSYFDYKKIKVVDDYAKNIDIKIDDYNSSDENVSISGNVVIQGHENKIIISDTNRKEIIELDESNINPDGSFTLENIDLSLFDNGKIIVQLEVVNGENKSLYGEVIEKNIIVNPEVEFTHKELISNILYLEGKVDPSLEGKYINISVNIPEIELSQVLIKEGGLWEYKEYITESIGLNVTAYVSDPSNSYMTNLGSLPASLWVVGEYYDYKSSELYINDSMYGEGGDIHFVPNVKEGHEIVKISFTDGNKEFSFTPPFDPEQKVFSTNAHGFNNTTLLVKLEVKDSYGNITVVQDTIEKSTYTDYHTNIYESYIEDGILYISGQNVMYTKGGSTIIFAIDESGKEITFTADVNSKGYWSTQVDVSSLTEGMISTKVQTPYTSYYQYIESYKTTEIGILESSAKAQVQIEDNDNILIEDEDINISGSISKNSTIGKLVLTDGNKEVELTDVDVNEDGSFNIENVDVSTFGNGEIRIQIEVKDENGNKAFTYDSIRKQIATNEEVNLEVLKHETQDDSVVISGTVNYKYYDEKVFAEFEDGTRAETVINKDGTWEIKDHISKALQKINVYTLHSDVISLNKPNDVVSKISISGMDEDENTTIYKIDENSIEKAKIEGFVLNGNTVKSLSITDGEETLLLDLDDIVYEGENFRLENIDVSSLKDGELKVELITQNSLGNEYRISNTILKDTSINIEFDESNVSIYDTSLSFGVKTDIGITNISAKIIDIKGNEKFISTTALWEKGVSFSNIDISSLMYEQGFFIEVFAKDKAGNTIEKKFSYGISTDVEAKIRIYDDEDSNRVIDASNKEVEKVRLEGKINVWNDIDKLYITDGENKVEISSDSINIDDEGNFVIEDIDVSSLTDGVLTAQLEVSNSKGESKVATQDIKKDTKVNIIFDEENSKIEDTTAHFSGKVEDVEIGRRLTIIFIDQEGKTIRITATVEDDSSWKVEEDISSLSGDIKAGAYVNDSANNNMMKMLGVLPVVDDTPVVVEPQVKAEINIYDEEDSNKVIDASSKEVEKVKLEGKINIGNSIDKLYITDGENKTQINPNNINIDKEGNFVIEDIDVSSLKDGILTVELEVSNGIGESKTVSQNIKKDTKANVILDEENSRVEDNIAYFSGKAEDIEAGKVITISFISQSGSNIRTTATVQKDGLWEVEQDVSSLSGNIKAMVYANDYSNNNVVKTIDLSLVESKQESIIDESETVDISKLIETQSLDLTNNKIDTVSLNLTEILDSTDADLELVINGELQDRIDLDKSQWTKIESLSMNDEVYNSYESINSTSTIKLLIENEIEII